MMHEAALNEGNPTQYARAELILKDKQFFIEFKQPPVYLKSSLKNKFMRDVENYHKKILHEQVESIKKYPDTEKLLKEFAKLVPNVRKHYDEKTNYMVIYIQSEPINETEPFDILNFV